MNMIHVFQMESMMVLLIMVLQNVPAEIKINIAQMILYQIFISYLQSSANIMSFVKNCYSLGIFLFDKL